MEYWVNCCRWGDKSLSKGRTKFHGTLLWRHNEHDSVSNHQPRSCLLNRLFRRRSKKTSKLRVTGLCVGNSPGPVNSPHKGPVTRKMFPFDDVIMISEVILLNESPAEQSAAWYRPCYPISVLFSLMRSKPHNQLSVWVSLRNVSMLASTVWIQKILKWRG